MTVSPAEELEEILPVAKVDQVHVHSSPNQPSPSGSVDEATFSLTGLTVSKVKLIHQRVGHNQNKTRFLKMMTKEFPVIDGNYFIALS